MTTKTFPLGTVLSITTGRLLAPNGIRGVYEILNHMTGDSIYTHQIPRVCEECKPALLRQFPDLANVDPSTVTNGNWLEFIKQQAEVHGAMLSVESLAPGEHYEIDPVSELAEMVHPSKIVVIDGGDK